MELGGIHHLTAVSASIRENLRFYTRTLGMRLVKRSVNQDDVSAYHLFYADAKGTPGTDLTFFDWPVPAEVRGTNSIVSTGLRVPGSEALDYWRTRFAELGVRVAESAERDGRLTLDFQDPEGQRLSLVEGAPATIALWFVDEQTGIWKEEGSATKTGNSYVGQVKHFSFWNCDIGIPAVNVTMTVKDQGGHPLVHVLVRIKRLHQNPQFAHGWTDSLGQVSGLVPANENLLLEVLDPCNNVIYSQNIGPFSQNTNLGTITVTPSSATSVLTIQGKLLNCSGSPVDSGFAIIYYDNMVRYAEVNSSGDFHTSFIQCAGSGSTYDLLPVDERNGQQGSLVTGNVVSPVTNAGNINACGTSASQFINYTLDGTNYSITSNDSLMAWTGPLQGTTQFRTNIQGSRFNSSGANNHIAFNFNHASAAAGTYAIDEFIVQNYNQVVLSTPFNVVITNFPQSVGQFYEGSITGTFTDNLSVSHNVTVSFRIRKTF